MATVFKKMKDFKVKHVLGMQHAFHVLSSSVLSGRARLAASLGKSFGGKRDLYDSLGYKAYGAIQYEDYVARYYRQDIAGRLIDAPVEGAWKQKPRVSESASDQTVFEEAWGALVKDYKIWSILTRFDKLIRLGRYGVLLFGFDDVTERRQLVEPVSPGRKLLYLQPYGEGSAVIHQWDEDPVSERYGLPKLYKLTLQEPGGTEGFTSQITVHHSRVLHVLEGALESNIYGMPYLERVFNNLNDLLKLVGGSAEMFWQGAFPGYAFVADPDADLTATASDLEEEIDKFVHEMKRYMKLIGLKVEKLAPDVADPSKHLEVQLKMVSIATGIPMRILTGSERGQLASTQDETHWNDKLQSRRIDYVEPDILRPVIDKLIEVGVLTEPADGYSIVWPDLNAPSQKDRSETGLILAKALKEYMSMPDAESFMPFEVFLEEILGLEKAVVERVMEMAGDDTNRMITEEDGDLVTAFRGDSEDQ